MLSSVALLHQQEVERAVQKAFPNANILVNTRNSFKNPVTGSGFEVDVWLPDLLLGFEYQDAYHYATTWYSNQNLAVIRSVDTKKTEEVRKSGVTLIHVPCWWDSDPCSLMATINFERPDLLPHASDFLPIEFNPPSDFNFLAKAYIVPGVGEVMLATFIVPPSKFALSIAETKPWWVGEKYDGIRCIWNPTTKELYSRRGLSIDLQSPILDQVPAFLDGEIWNGRGRYAETQDIVLAEVIHWENLRIVTFDDPSPLSAHLPFESRYEKILTLLLADHPLLIVASRFLCNNLTRLENLLQVVLIHHGEGLILRRPKSGYDQGRSPNLVKLKAAATDSEALVLGVANKTVKVQLTNSTVIELPKPANLGKLKIGDVVTIDYEVYTRRAPVSPTILRIRTDVSWEDILREHSRDARKSSSQKGAVLGFSTKPLQYWTTEKGKKALRAALEKYVRSKKLDPHLPATWYNISRKELLKSGVVGEHIVAKAGGLPKMIEMLFPNLHLEEAKFNIFPVGFWKSMVNRKKFLDDFARENKFDPLIAQNWYKITTRQFRAMKGSGLLNHYENIYSKAIINVYPNIGLDPGKFLARGKNFREDHTRWKDPKNHKAFFDEYAKTYNFDPLVAGNWYKYHSKLNDSKGAYSFRGQLNGISLHKLLPNVYPNIGLDMNLFPKDARHWKSLDNCRKFFHDYAKNNGFDPLIASNWYNVTFQDLKEHKGSRSILFYHNFSLKRALQWVYPDIGLDPSLFQQKNRKSWQDEGKRKAFFDDLAKARGFDPLIAENWYTLEEVDAKRVRFVIHWANGDYAKVLANAYPNVTFNTEKFLWAQGPYSKRWTFKKHRKVFFNHYAKSEKFDPLVAKNWYQVTVPKIKQYKHAAAILSLFGDKLSAALADAYPDIGIDPKLFVGYKKMHKYQREQSEDQQNT
eukprot:Phypoly_transcript_02194.p1 GENE.Phypoly_transcript_02194~~Phypoly_transcript_02194.p1  ORF type:complete len:921 (+),score=154.23 Phypoly_transcript_02194:106-2868(+)